MNIGIFTSTAKGFSLKTYLVSKSKSKMLFIRENKVIES